MLILVDLFEFVEFLCTHGPEKSKEKPFYKLIEHILKKLPNFSCAVPYFILFENEEFIDLIRHDHVKYNPIYDENISSFIFNNIHDLFYGIFEILKKINYEYPNVMEVEDKYTKMKLFLNIVENTVNMNDLCELFTTL
jgi:hypothetical protein